MKRVKKIRIANKAIKGLNNNVIAKFLLCHAVVVAYLGLTRKQDGGYTGLKTSYSFISPLS